MKTNSSVQDANDSSVLITEVLHIVNFQQEETGVTLDTLQPNFFCEGLTEKQTAGEACCMTLPFVNVIVIVPALCSCRELLQGQAAKDD